MAKAGRSVAVFERREVVGGAAVSETDVWPGYTLSTASYVCSLLDPWLVEELDLRDRGLSYYRKDPYAFTPLLDGRSLLLGTNRESNAREIAAFDPRDVAGFEAYVERTDSLGRALFDTFSDDDPRFDRFDSETQRRAPRLGGRFGGTLRFDAGAAGRARQRRIDRHVPRSARRRERHTCLAHHLAGRLLGAQGAWAFVRGGMGVGLAARSLRRRSVRRRDFLRMRSVTAVRRRRRATPAASSLGSSVSSVRAGAVVSNAHPRTTFLESARLLDFR